MKINLESLVKKMLVLFVVMGQPTITNGEADVTAYAINGSNGTYTVSGGINIVIMKNVQIYNGGGTAASNDTRFTLEIPATATVPDSNTESLSDSALSNSSIHLSSSTNEQRILVIGDSWASAVVAETQRDEGWPEMMGLPSVLRQGIDGSTAGDWASDRDGTLTRALATPCERVVISLGGNDMFHAYSDREITPQEISSAMASLKKVVSAFQNKVGIKNVWLLLYSNPYQDQAYAKLVTLALRAGQISACPEGTQTIDTADVLNSPDCWANGDYNPSFEGNVRIANLVKTAVQ